MRQSIPESCSITRPRQLLTLGSILRSSSALSSSQLSTTRANAKFAPPEWSCRCMQHWPGLRDFHLARGVECYIRTSKQLYRAHDLLFSCFFLFCFLFSISFGFFFLVWLLRAMYAYVCRGDVCVTKTFFLQHGSSPTLVQRMQCMKFPQRQKKSLFKKKSIIGYFYSTYFKTAIEVSLYLLLLYFYSTCCTMPQIEHLNATLV